MFSSLKRNRHGPRRRGISTVITSLLLIVGTAIIGSGLIAWGTTNFNIQQTRIGTQLSNEGNQARETMMLEDVWFFTNATSPFNYANVTIRDTGVNSFTLSSIMLNNTQAWTGQNAISPGNSTTIAIADNWGKGKPQSIWVNTKLGTNVKGVWVP